MTRKAELSYEFLPNWWGKGFAFEAIHAVIEHTFNTTKYKTLMAITQSKNAKSVKLLEVLGMKPVKTKMMFNEEQSIYRLTYKKFTLSSQ